MACQEINGTGRFRSGRRGRVYDSKEECEKAQKAVKAKGRQSMINKGERDESAKGN